ncbi:serine hydrolase domain-containing protein [Zhongshania aliphaticivorans]|uniref:serine hydrolase domain-containing protein n=1 Tax=Zhongshania aliphaticivorans TaxID=1470434 RepID=UPI0013310649|nr:serine hydrolase domain-containing protein [Zhongshania aliphaticivorans]
MPEDISTLIDIGRNEVPATQQGLAQDDIDKLWRHAESLFSSGMHPMVSVCLRRGGDVLLNRTLGYADGANHTQPRVASLQTPVCLFSASKAVSAMLIHKLAEDGLIDLLNPVSHYIPAFAAEGKAQITIHQLLSHRAGVPGVPDDVAIELLFNPKAAVEQICKQPSLHNDGRILAYHAITGGFIQAELIRVVTGKTLNEYLDEVVRKPMGMHYFRYGLEAKDHELVARNYATGLPNIGVVERQLVNILGAGVSEVVDISNSEAFLSAEIASANLYATAEETSRFFQMLLQGGVWQGKQIFTPLTVNRAVREMGKPQFDRSLILVPMRYSAGMMLGLNPVGLYGPKTHYAYGHLGFSNILCWADPERDIAVSILTSGKPVLGNHLLSLGKLLNGISSTCKPCVDMQHIYSKVL